LLSTTKFLMRTILRIVFLPAALCCWDCGYTHVSDDELTQRFNRNETIFNALRDMAAWDAGFVLISPRMVTTSGAGSPSDGANSGMDPQRLAE
jgi:hypothetical protein